MSKTATLDEMVAEAVLEEAGFELGKPSRTAIVNDFDANGEAIAHEVPIESPDDGQNVSTNVQVDAEKPTLPGFEGLVVDAIAINLSGRPDINYYSPMDRALWEACRRGQRITVMCDVVVTDIKDHLKMDSDWNDKERTGSVSLKVRRVYLPEFAGWAELQDESHDDDDMETYPTVD